MPDRKVVSMTGRQDSGVVSWNVKRDISTSAHIMIMKHCSSTRSKASVTESTGAKFNTSNLSDSTCGTGTVTRSGGSDRRNSVKASIAVTARAVVVVGMVMQHQWMQWGRHCVQPQCKFDKPWHMTSQQLQCLKMSKWVKHDTLWVDLVHGFAADGVF